MLSRRRKGDGGIGTAGRRRISSSCERMRASRRRDASSAASSRSLRSLRSASSARSRSLRSLRSASSARSRRSRRSCSSASRLARSRRSVSSASRRALESKDVCDVEGESHWKTPLSSERLRRRFVVAFRRSVTRSPTLAVMLGSRRKGPPRSSTMIGRPRSRCSAKGGVAGDEGAVKTCGRLKCMGGVLGVGGESTITMRSFLCSRCGFSAGRTTTECRLLWRRWVGCGDSSRRLSLPRDRGGVFGNCTRGC